MLENGIIRQTEYENIKERQNRPDKLEEKLIIPI